VNPIPVVTFAADVTQGCVPLTVNFTNTTPNSSNCIWTMGNGDVINGCGPVSSIFNQAGCFDVTLMTTSTAGCTSNATTLNMICVENNPIASFTQSQNTLTTIDTEVQFTNTSVGGIDYVWNFGDNSSTSSTFSPTHLYPEVGGSYQISLTVSTLFGCTDVAYSTIKVEEDLLYYVPNTFTPDLDNFNPTFKPVFTSGFDPYDYTLLIFNRWGEIVFESHDANIGWDGSYGSKGEINMSQDGTYTWKIEFKLLKNDERKFLVGHVNLLR